jgi:hypothetical protein
MIVDCGEAFCSPSTMKCLMFPSTMTLPPPWLREGIAEMATSKGFASSAHSTKTTSEMAGIGSNLARVDSKVGVSTVILALTSETLESCWGVMRRSNGRSERCQWALDMLPKNCEFAPGSAMYTEVFRLWSVCAREV